MCIFTRCEKYRRRATNHEFSRVIPVFCLLTVRAKGCEIRIKLTLGTANLVREFELSVFDLSEVEQYRIKKDFAGTDDLVRVIHGVPVIRVRGIEVRLYYLGIIVILKNKTCKIQQSCLCRSGYILCFSTLTSC